MPFGRGPKCFVQVEARGFITNIHKWAHFQSQGQWEGPQKQLYLLPKYVRFVVSGDLNTLGRNKCFNLFHIFGTGSFWRLSWRSQLV